MVSNKKYIYALQKWHEWENMATDVAKQNGVLLKEMKEINDLSMRVNEHSEALIAECRRLREQLAAVTAEAETAKKIFADLDIITSEYMNNEDYSMGDVIFDIDDLKEKYGVED